MGKIWKNLVTVIYGIGAAIVFILSAFVAFRSHIVLFPDAMLPMELRELSTIWLMFGSLPMLIFSVLFYKVHEISKSNHKIRNTILTYIPVAVCLICALFWICVWAIGMMNMVINMTK